MSRSRVELSKDLMVTAARLVRATRRLNPDLPWGAGMRLLSLIDEAGPSTVGHLAQADYCSQPTMTGLVNGLVTKGWLGRTPNPADARSSLVSMTDAGRAALADLRGANARAIAARSTAAGISSEDLATTVAVLKQLLGHERA